MSQKLTMFVFALSLLLCVVGGAAPVVRADEERTVSTSKRTGCDYDRNASSDEEKTSGHCGGTVPTPEPVSIILFSAGLAGVGFAARRRLRRSE